MTQDDHMYVGSFCSSPSSSRQSSRHSLDAVEDEVGPHHQVAALAALVHARRRRLPPREADGDALVGAVAVVRGDAAACELDQPAELVHGGLLGRRPEPPTMTVALPFPDHQCTPNVQLAMMQRWLKARSNRILQWSRLNSYSDNDSDDDGRRR